MMRPQGSRPRAPLGAGHVARRLVLPAALAVAASVAWLLSASLGQVASDSAPPLPVERVDVPLASVRRLPDIATAARRHDVISQTMAQLPAPPTPLSCAVIMVDGVVVYDLRADERLVPGFAQLLLTGHSALELLGPDFRYETRIMAEDRPDADGHIANTLYVVGGGDPVLMTRGHAQTFRPTLATRSSFEELVQGVLDMGVVWVGSGVVGIERRYDTERAVPGWPAYAEAGLVGPMSALQLDDGLLARAANGRPAVAAEDPAAMVAGLVETALRDQGVEMFGLSRADDPEEVLDDLVPISTVRSAPLVEIVRQVFAVNDAGAAELIMKELGLHLLGEGSTRAGAAAVGQVASQLGTDLVVEPRDGSGLDPVQTSSCATLARFGDAIPSGHPTLQAWPEPQLPGVYDGGLVHLETQAELRVLGGSIGTATGVIARTVDDGPRLVVASLINRPRGITDRDVEYHQQVLAMVDEIRSAHTQVAIDEGQP